MKAYSKAIAAAGAALGVIASALADGSVTQAEGFAIFAAVAGVYAVYKARNVSAS